MINVGDYLEIEGKEVLVCFSLSHNNVNYFCSSYDEDGKVYFDIYKYKTENEKLMVAKVKDEEELKPVVQKITAEAIEEFGLPSDFEEALKKFLIKEQNN